MSLDERVRQGRMGRRDFLEIAARTAGIISIGSIPLINSACKNSPAGPELPVPVTLQFDVYNHLQGYRASFTRNTTSGQNVNIKISECGANDVDSERIAVRQDNFGKLEVFSRTGEAAFTAPRQNLNYDVILFNSTNNAPYQRMDDQNSQLYKNKRNYTVYRKDFDGQTGPEDVWENVFDQLNSALDLGWVKWGSISRQSSGDFSYGYGNSYDNAGWHAGNWITINPKQCSNELVMIMVGFEEAFENICNVDNNGHGI